MVIKLRMVDVAEKAEFRDMLSTYLLDLKRFGAVDLSYPFFETYWTDKSRWPYFIERDSEIAGFVLLNTWSPSGKGTDFAIAEFCVFPEYRKTGIGQAVFHRLLKSRPGIWEIGVMRRNQPACAFWRISLASVDISAVERINAKDMRIYRHTVKRQVIVKTRRSGAQTLRQQPVIPAQAGIFLCYGIAGISVGTGLAPAEVSMACICPR